MILSLCTDCCCFLKGGFSFSQKNFLYLSSEKGSYLRIKKKGGGGGGGVFIPADLLSSVILFYFYLFLFILNPAMVLFDYKFQAISISRNTIFFIAEPWDEM